MPDPALTYKDGLVENVKLRGSLCCSDHEMVGFKTFRATRRVHSKLHELQESRSDQVLSWDLMSCIHGS